jgi:hypothetical protein
MEGVDEDRARLHLLQDRPQASSVLSSFWRTRAHSPSWTSFQMGLPLVNDFAAATRLTAPAY